MIATGLVVCALFSFYLFYYTYNLHSVNVLKVRYDDHSALPMLSSFIGNTSAIGSNLSLPHPVLRPRKRDFARRFPQAIIIGVRKGGTRALIDMLCIHPDIASPRGEVHFFDRIENYNKGVEWYINLMPNTVVNQITIEKSPSYFVTPDTPERISMANRTLKLILIVKNPVDRAISDFAQLDAKRTKKNGSRQSFEDLAFLSSGKVNAHYGPIAVSAYDIHMERWLKHFDLKQFIVVNGDALIKDPLPELQKVESFLGVNSYFTEDMFYFNATKGFYCWKKPSKSGVSNFCLGSGKGRGHPTISEEALSKLKAFFKPHNERFYSLVGQNFSW